MNNLFWALQIILAIKLLTVTLNHGLRPDASKLKRGMDSLGTWTRPTLGIIGLTTLLAALALILPVAGSFLPYTSACTALLMLAATGFHLHCRETPRVWVSLILCGLAALLTYGRLLIHPL